MNNSDLKKIYSIRKVLENSGYLDIERISNEIYTYSIDKHIPLEGILKGIKSGKPWEYICGEVEFYGNIFKISKHTLIPRIETEDLVNISIKEIKKYSPTLVIDIGAGSGCIVLSLAKQFRYENIKFLGTDISQKALEVAKENEKRLKLNNTTFKKEYLLKTFSPKKRYCIVANLPYIPTEKYLKLDKSVKNYEPRIALDGGENGLLLYEELFKQISEMKNKPLFITIEFDPNTKEGLLQILKIFFPGKKYSFKKDFRGKERFLIISF